MENKGLDLIPQEGSVIYDEDNFISLVYRDDNIFSFSSDSIIDIPIQQGFEENYQFNDLQIDPFNEELTYTLEQLILENPIATSLAEQLGIPIPLPPEGVLVNGSVFNILSSVDIGSTQIELDDFSEISFIDALSNFQDFTFGINLCLTILVFSLFLLSVTIFGLFILPF